MLCFKRKKNNHRQYFEQIKDDKLFLIIIFFNLNYAKLQSFNLLNMILL